MSSLASKTRADRCCNSFDLESHKGKSLRKIPNSLLRNFPDFTGFEKICHSCRKLTSAKHNESGLSEEAESSFLNSGDEDGPSMKIPHLSREEELEEMPTGLKNRFSSLSPTDPLRLMILTIAPDCWGVMKTAKEFGTSKRTVHKARKLKESSGILSTSVAKSGKTLSDDLVHAVKSFYEDDENSRMMPNQKDVITVIHNGEKQKRQKRLVLCDIKSLHNQFKEKFPHFQISFSKFAELRPKWCVSAGSKGIHTVCVCTIHQNF